MTLKKWGSIALVCMMSVSMLAGCSSKDADSGSSKDKGAANGKVNASGFPIVNDTITVSGFAGKFFANADWNNLDSGKSTRKCPMFISSGIRCRRII